MTMKLALLIAVAAMSPRAFAGDVYRCQDAAGKIEFRDRPCDAGHKAQKVDVTPNSIQTMTLEEVRAKSAELKAKQQARQDAENKANANAYASRWQQERAVQDAIDLQQAGREQTQDYGGYYAGQTLQPPATPSPPPPPPKAPAMPTPPPKPPGSM